VSIEGAIQAEPGAGGLRSLARGSALYVAGNLVPRFGAFLLLPIVTRFLGRADFGTVSLTASLALLLSILYRLGLDGALLRFHFDVDDRVRPGLYATLAALTGATVAVGSVLLTAMGAALDPGRPGVPFVPFGLLALSIGGLMAFHYVPSVFFRAADRPGRYLLLALASFGVTAVATLVLVAGLRLGAAGALLGQLAGASVVGATAIAVLVGLRPRELRPELARRALSFGLPLLPQAMAGWLLSVSDRWLIGWLIGLSAAEALAAVGVYSLGYQLGYAVGLVAISFNAAWLPFFYRVGEGRHGPAVLRDMTTLTVAGFIALAGTMALLAPEIVGLMAPPEWSAAADVTAVVAFASVANAAGLMVSSVFTLTRRTRPLATVTLVAAGVNLSVNAALIPILGIMGAAWATLAAYIVLAGLAYVVGRRHYPILVDVPRLVTALVTGVTVVVVARQIPQTGAGPALATHVVLALVLAALIALLVRAPAARLRTLAAAPWSASGSAGSLD
jgi:O-antigen/teichoic acid export membrane protein